MIGQTPPDPVADEAMVPVPGAVPLPVPAPETVTEIGGRGGLEPTRYGDWEKDGRCIDF
jgi:hypothetical protein